ncbi:uncharacterized protein BP5553_02793 [Venustampulla echinocandica]|uniref:Uncharacterized protein n=1 Tax=Venustampulla echinocandica TaxID=2656787 RepID=A0A370TSH2_9HELO|nr:uncharacterized protein BP5553_02793 [Venustampulla echinocandica]RDL38453.1 hypothetical protein BP5553_02793 [Venustampulla echinocandica]
MRFSTPVVETLEPPNSRESIRPQLQPQPQPSSKPQDSTDNIPHLVPLHNPHFRNFTHNLPFIPARVPPFLHTTDDNNNRRNSRFASLLHLHLHLSSRLPHPDSSIRFPSPDAAADHQPAPQPPSLPPSLLHYPPPLDASFRFLMSEVIAPVRTSRASAREGLARFD